MTIRPLMIGSPQREDIRRVVEHAERNRIGKDEMEMLNRRFLDGDTTAVGDDPQSRCVIPYGYGAVFSIEEHGQGWCRHLSVSVGEKDCLPSLQAIYALSRLFGFRGTPNDWVQHGTLWREKHVSAVSVLEPLDWQPSAVPSLPISVCPTCGYEATEATGFGAKGSPQEGDLSVCLNCGEWLQFNEILVAKKMPEGLFETLDVETRGILEKARKFIRERGRLR